MASILLDGKRASGYVNVYSARERVRILAGLGPRNTFRKVRRKPKLFHREIFKGETGTDGDRRIADGAPAEIKRLLSQQDYHLAADQAKTLDRITKRAGEEMA